ncbi:MAG: zinc-ribbon domain-containing protein [bacterium]|nr:zinc-ribbon domain-containing protein [bacterium]
MTEKKCPDCSATVPAGSKFCPECGAPVQAAGKSGKPGKKASHALRDNLIIVGVIAAIGIGYVLVREPEEPPVPVQEVAQNQANPHGGDMESMMGALPNIPTDFEGLVGMGNTNMDQSNYAVAAECYKRALAIKADAYDVRTDFGACLHGMGLAARAMEEFNKVIAEHPEHGIANFNLGIVHYSMKNNDSAKYYWEQYLQIDPNGSAAEAARDYLKQIGG